MPSLLPFPIALWICLNFGKKDLNYPHELLIHFLGHDGSGMML
jgi:hypothetical protein